MWVVTYPKCGTTWAQELVWQVAHGLDLEGGKTDLMERFPFMEFLEWDAFGNDFNPANYKTLAQLDSVEGRRFIKTHLPLSLLPPCLLDTGKVVYVARNPRDAMVSYYHHHKLIRCHQFTGDFKTFAERFMKDQVMYSPFFQHCEEAWQLRESPNLLFIFFEDMKKDMKSVVERVARFLGTSLTPEQVAALVHHLDIEQFRQNAAVNKENIRSTEFLSDGSFIRKGEVGGWKEDFKSCPEMEEEFSRWISQQMKTSTIEFSV